MIAWPFDVCASACTRHSEITQLCVVVVCVCVFARARACIFWCAVGTSERLGLLHELEKLELTKHDAESHRPSTPADGVPPLARSSPQECVVVSSADTFGGTSGAPRQEPCAGAKTSHVFRGVNEPSARGAADEDGVDSGGAGVLGDAAGSSAATPARLQSGANAPSHAGVVSNPTVSRLCGMVEAMQAQLAVSAVACSVVHIRAHHRLLCLRSNVSCWRVVYACYGISSIWTRLETSGCR